MPTGTLAEKARRVYECRTCQKRFKRSEHCKRHERGHTNEKPYGCRFCPRKYARKDLVSRHEQSFHPHGDFVVLDGSLDSGPRASSANLEAQEGPDAGDEGEIPPKSHGQQKPPISLSQEDVNNAFRYSQDADMAAHAPETDEPVAAKVPYVSLPVDAASSHHDVPIHHQIYNANGSSNLGSSWDPGLLVDNDFNGTLDDTGIGQQGDAHDFDFFNILPTLSNGPVDINFSNYMFNSGYAPTCSDDSPSSAKADVGQFWPDPGVGITNNNHTLRSSAVSMVQQQIPPSDVSAARQGSHSFARIPSIVSTKPAKTTIPILSDENYRLVLEDIRSRLSPVQFAGFRLPSPAKLQQFATSYFGCFHHHFPILHIPTLFIHHTHYSPMILATCSIGALYRLNRKVAQQLWHCANMMVEAELKPRSDAAMRPYPTAPVQVKLILTIYAVFSGDPEVVLSAAERTAWWSTEYRRRLGVLGQQPAALSTSWEDWCEREMSKRLLCGIFILSSLLTVTYGTTPFLNLVQDLNLEMPEEENRWEARSTQAWQDALQTSTPLTRTTVRAALSELMFDLPPRVPSSQPKNTWSSIGLVVVMHAVNVHMWHTRQCNPDFSSLYPLASHPSEGEIVRRTESALTRCHVLISTSPLPEDAGEEGSSLLFNCQALLRVAYVRLFTGAGSFDLMMLLSSNEDELMRHLRVYVNAPQQRTDFLTAAVGKAYEGFLVPIKAGYLMSRKTAALSWSVEHAVAGWDCALFVTKWVHVVETHSLLLSAADSPSARAKIPPVTPDELKNIHHLRMLLAEVDSDFVDGVNSLAAEVVRTWAELLDDTWVWGTTPRMGTVLRALGNVYDEKWKQMREFHA